MLASDERVSVWTEGLDKNWIHKDQSRGRIKRGTFSVRNLPSILGHIRKKNPGELDCLIILQGYEQMLHLRMENGRFFLSNPQDLNYQNVEVDLDGVVSVVDHFFSPKESPFTYEWRKSVLIQGSVFTLVLAGLVGSVVYLFRFLLEEASFFPTPIVMEIDDPTEAAGLIRKHSGFYVTGIADGEMALELSPGGAFHYFDILRGAPGHYLLETVDSGGLRPAYEAGQQVLIAETGYIFYPMEDGDLSFQNRPYNRVGATREDVPYFSLPAGED